MKDQFRPALTLDQCQTTIIFQKPCQGKTRNDREATKQTLERHRRHTHGLHRGKRKTWDTQETKTHVQPPSYPRDTKLGRIIEIGANSRKFLYFILLRRKPFVFKANDGGQCTVMRINQKRKKTFLSQASQSALSKNFSMPQPKGTMAAYFVFTIHSYQHWGWVCAFHFLDIFKFQFLHARSIAKRKKMRHHRFSAVPKKTLMEISKVGRVPGIQPLPFELKLEHPCKRPQIFF